MSELDYYSVYTDPLIQEQAYNEVEERKRELEDARNRVDRNHAQAAADVGMTFPELPPEVVVAAGLLGVDVESPYAEALFDIELRTLANSEEDPGHPLLTIPKGISRTAITFFDAVYRDTYNRSLQQLMAAQGPAAELVRKMPLLGWGLHGRSASELDPTLIDPTAPADAELFWDADRQLYRPMDRSEVEQRQGGFATMDLLKGLGREIYDIFGGPNYEMELGSGWLPAGRYPQERPEWAQMVLSGVDPEEATQRMYAMGYSDPIYREYARRYENAIRLSPQTGVSPGTVIAHGTGLDPDTQAFRYFSGAVDFAAQILDPTGIALARYSKFRNLMRGFDLGYHAPAPAENIIGGAYRRFFLTPRTIEGWLNETNQGQRLVELITAANANTPSAYALWELMRAYNPHIHPNFVDELVQLESPDAVRRVLGEAFMGTRSADDVRLGRSGVGYAMLRKPATRSATSRGLARAVTWASGRDSGLGGAMREAFGMSPATAGRDAFEILRAEVGPEWNRTFAQVGGVRPAMRIASVGHPWARFFAEMPTRMLDPFDPIGASHAIIDFGKSASFDIRHLSELYGSLTRLRYGDDAQLRGIATRALAIFDEQVLSNPARGRRKINADTRKELLNIKEHTDEILEGLKEDRSALGSHYMTQWSVLEDGTIKFTPAPAYLAQGATRSMSMPDPRKVRRALSKVSYWTSNADLDLRAVPFAVDWFMSKVWKPTVLLRLAWLVRVGMEEQARMAAMGYDTLFTHPLHAFLWTWGKGKNAAIIDEAIDQAKWFKAAMSRGDMGFLHNPALRAERYKTMKWLYKGDDPTTEVAGWSMELQRMSADPLMRIIAADLRNGTDNATKWLLDSDGGRAYRAQQQAQVHNNKPAVAAWDDFTHLRRHIEYLRAHVAHYTGAEIRRIDARTGEAIQQVTADLMDSGALRYEIDGTPAPDLLDLISGGVTYRTYGEAAAAEWRDAAFLVQPGTYAQGFMDRTMYPTRAGDPIGYYIAGDHVEELTYPHGIDDDPFVQLTERAHTEADYYEKIERARAYAHWAMSEVAWAQRYGGPLLGDILAYRVADQLGLHRLDELLIEIDDMAEQLSDVAQRWDQFDDILHGVGPDQLDELTRPFLDRVQRWVESQDPGQPDVFGTEGWPEIAQMLLGPAGRLDTAERARFFEGYLQSRAGWPSWDTSPTPAEKAAVAETILLEDAHAIVMADAIERGIVPAGRLPTIRRVSLPDDFADLNYLPSPHLMGTKVYRARVTRLLEALTDGDMNVAQQTFLKQQWDLITANADLDAARAARAASGPDWTEFLTASRRRMIDRSQAHGYTVPEKIAASVGRTTKSRIRTVVDRSEVAAEETKMLRKVLYEDYYDRYFPKRGIVGPQYRTGQLKSRWDRILDTAYHGFMGAPSNFFARAPLFRQAYWRSMERLAAYIDPGDLQRMIDDMPHQPPDALIESIPGFATARDRMMRVSERAAKIRGDRAPALRYQPDPALNVIHDIIGGMDSDDIAMTLWQMAKEQTLLGEQARPLMERLGEQITDWMGVDGADEVEILTRMEANAPELNVGLNLIFEMAASDERVGAALDRVIRAIELEPAMRGTDIQAAETALVRVISDYIYENFYRMTGSRAEILSDLYKSYLGGELRRGVAYEKYPRLATEEPFLAELAAEGGRRLPTEETIIGPNDPRELASGIQAFVRVMNGRQGALHTSEVGVARVFDVRRSSPGQFPVQGHPERTANLPDNPLSPNNQYIIEQPRGQAPIVGYKLPLRLFGYETPVSPHQVYAAPGTVLNPLSGVVVNRRIGEVERARPLRQPDALADIYEDMPWSNLVRPTTMPDEWGWLPERKGTGYETIVPADFRVPFGILNEGTATPGASSPLAGVPVGTGTPYFLFDDYNRMAATFGAQVDTIAAKYPFWAPTQIRELVAWSWIEAIASKDPDFPLHFWHAVLDYRAELDQALRIGGPEIVEAMVRQMGKRAAPPWTTGTGAAEAYQRALETPEAALMGMAIDRAYRAFGIETPPIDLGKPWASRTFPSEAQGQTPWGSSATVASLPPGVGAGPAHRPATWEELLNYATQKLRSYDAFVEAAREFPSVELATRNFFADPTVGFPLLARSQGIDPEIARQFFELEDLRLKRQLSVDPSEAPLWHQDTLATVRDAVRPEYDDNISWPPELNALYDDLGLDPCPEEVIVSVDKGAKLPLQVRRINDETVRIVINRRMLQRLHKRKGTKNPSQAMERFIETQSNGDPAAWWDIYGAMPYDDFETFLIVFAERQLSYQGEQLDIGPIVDAFSSNLRPDIAALTDLRVRDIAERQQAATNIRNELLKGSHDYFPARPEAMPDGSLFGWEIRMGQGSLGAHQGVLPYFAYQTIDELEDAGNAVVALEPLSDVLDNFGLSPDDIALILDQPGDTQAFIGAYLRSRVQLESAGLDFANPLYTKTGVRETLDYAAMGVTPEDLDRHAMAVVLKVFFGTDDPRELSHLPLVSNIAADAAWQDAVLLANRGAGGPARIRLGLTKRAFARRAAQEEGRITREISESMANDPHAWLNYLRSQREQALVRGEDPSLIGGLDPIHRQALFGEGKTIEARHTGGLEASRADAIDQLIRQAIERTVNRAWARMRRQAGAGGGGDLTVARRNWMDYAESGINLEDWDAIAKAEALTVVREILYDLNKRHQLSDVLRNVFPFGEAWLEILRTWGKIGYENPQVIRRASQLMLSGRAKGQSDEYLPFGLYTDDQTGEEYFQMPLMDKILTPLVTGNIPGEGAPIRASSRMLLKNVNLFTGSVIPGFGPAVQWPVHALESKIPFLEWVGEYTDPYKQFESPMSLGDIADFARPTWVKNLMLSLDKNDPRMARTFGSTQTQLAQLMLMNGEHPMTQEGLIEVENEAHRLAGWYAAIKAAGTFIGPTTPNIRLEVQDKNGKWWQLGALGEEYYRILEAVGGDDNEAMRVFYDRFGPAIDATVLGTPRTRQATPRAYTAEGSEWEQQNPRLFELFPTTAYYAHPDREADPLDWDAYMRQFMEGNLRPRSTEQWLLANNDLRGRLAFESERQRIEATNASSKMKDRYLSEYRVFLMDLYPGFNRDIFGEIKQPDTLTQIRELYRWVDDNSDEARQLRETEAGQGVVAYLRERDAMVEIAQQRGLTAWRESTFNTSAKAADLRDYLADYGEWLISQYPEFYVVWNRVFRRELIAGPDENIPAAPEPVLEPSTNLTQVGG